jgi:threonine synthase
VGDPSHRYSLGEGDTPMLEIPNLAEQLGLGELYLKDESSNPSGSFKARGMAVAVSRALELGLREFVLPTAGNAGGALAVYTVRSGATAHIFMPDDAPDVHRMEIEATGIEIEFVDGLLDFAGQAAAEAGEKHGWFNMATFKEPYRVEGKKIMGYELLEDFGWEYPDVILYPTGGGTGLVGMWKAFDEAEALGWVSGERPRMITVQAEGCAPVVRALRDGAERVAPWEGAVTSAQGLRVPSVFADRLILRAVRESKGVGVSVSERDIYHAQKDLAEHEGILACLEGAATLAGLKRLLANGQIDHSERILLFNTGSGLKNLI